MQKDGAQILERLTEEDLNVSIVALGPAGHQWVNTVSEILAHLLSHGQHHRGQSEWIVEQETGAYLTTSYMPYLRHHS